MRATRQFRFALGPSHRLAGAILFAHATAALCAAVAIRQPFGSLLAVLLAGLGALAAWDRAWLRSTRSIRAIEINEGGEALLERADGAQLRGPIGRRRHVSRYWVAMTVHCTAAIPILVAADMLDEREFRALRMWALWSRLPRLAPARQGS